MVAPSHDFIEVVARARGLHVTGAGGHAVRLEPPCPSTGESPAWYCELDDGTPTGESDPASFVRWVCPALRVVRPRTASATPLLEVHRTGPQSDLGRLVSWLGRRTGRSSGPPSAVGVRGGYAYTDPHGIFDTGLRERAEHWPVALHGDGAVRPAELWSIQVTGEGLVLTSVSWWSSAPALDHQIALAVDVAARLSAQQVDRPRS